VTPALVDDFYRTHPQEFDTTLPQTASGAGPTPAVGPSVTAGSTSSTSTPENTVLAFYVDAQFTNYLDRLAAQAVVHVDSSRYLQLPVG
jgi:hypothetical protein